MSKPDLIRAWKDEDYYLSLSEEQRSLLPEHPAGGVELSDEEMNAAAGGTLTATLTFFTVICRTRIFAGEDLCIFVP